MKDERKKAIQGFVDAFNKIGNPHEGWVNTADVVATAEKLGQVIGEGSQEDVNALIGDMAQIITGREKWEVSQHPYKCAGPGKCAECDREAGQ